MPDIFKNSNEVICLEGKAFKELISTLVLYIKQQHAIGEDEWLSTEAAMKLLGITSKTSLQYLRDTNQIAYTRPFTKVILYNRKSINEYLKSKQTIYE